MSLGVGSYGCSWVKFGVWIRVVNGIGPYVAVRDGKGVSIGEGAGVGINGQ